MEYKCTVELKGNLFDTLTLTKVLDEITENSCFCKIKEIKVGETRTEDSYARVKINSDNKKTLDALIKRLAQHGAVPVKTVSKTVEIHGHIIDSMTLSKVLDIIFNNNIRCKILDIKIGLEKKDFSYAKIKIFTNNQKDMDNILGKIVSQGAAVVE